MQAAASNLAATESPEKFMKPKTMISTTSRKVILAVKIETQESTIDYYHERRLAVLQEISGMENPHCAAEGCSINWKYSDMELHVHHIDEEDSHADVSGGWNHLYKLEEDVRNNVEMEIRCREHHEEIHDRQLFQEEIHV